MDKKEILKQLIEKGEEYHALLRKADSCRAYDDGFFDDAFCIQMGLDDFMAQGWDYVEEHFACSDFDFKMKFVHTEGHVKVYALAKEEELEALKK